MSKLNSSASGDCQGILPAQAIQGMELFNHGEYFEAHEALEAAWRAEPGPVRDLYRGVLQVAVVYLHITRHNYPGAIKVYHRCLRWLDLWPETCRGVAVGQLKRDLQGAIQNLQELGPQRILEFDISQLKPVRYTIQEAL